MQIPKDKPVDTWSVQREGIRVLAVRVTDQEVDLEKLFQVLAAQYVPTLACVRIRATRRILVCLPFEPPCLATVRRQAKGALYLKPDHGYGRAYRDEELEGRLYPIEALEVLHARWILDQRQEVDNWNRPAPSTWKEEP